MIADLLDRYLSALRQAGYVGTAPQPGPDHGDVRQRLIAAGYGDRDDVVQFFGWADYPAPNGSFSLFHETPDPLNLNDALVFGESMRGHLQNALAGFGVSSAADLTPGLVDLTFSGPAHRLPILQLDGAEYVSVDTSDSPDLGGSVWFSYASSESLKMFDSLAQAIETAIYCVEAGLWEVDEDGYEIVCPHPVL